MLALSRAGPRPPTTLPYVCISVLGDRTTFTDKHSCSEWTQGSNGKLDQVHADAREWQSEVVKSTCFSALLTRHVSSLHHHSAPLHYLRHVDTHTRPSPGEAELGSPTERLHESNALEFEGAWTARLPPCFPRRFRPSLPPTTTPPLPPQEQPLSCCRRRYRPKYLHGKHRQLEIHSELTRKTSGEFLT